MDDPPGSSEPTEPSSGPDTIPSEPAGSGGRAEPGPAPSPMATAWWPLRRSIRSRKLKGVAGGLAAAADLDPTLVRLLFVVAAFSGWGIVAYIVLAIVLQDETGEEPARPLPRDARRNLRIGLGLAAVVAFGRLFDGWFFGGGDMGVPFLLIAVGAAVLWARRDQQPGTLPPPPPTMGDNGLGEAPADGPPWAAIPAPPLGAGIDWRSTGRDLLRLAAAFVAVGALLALLGGAFLVVAGAVPMRLPFLPAAVAVAGVLGLLVSVVRRGRVVGLLLPGGVLLVAAALAVGLASFPGTAGNRVVVIGPGTELLGRYEHSAGRLVLDLRHLRLEPGGQRRVVARVGTGQLSVIVPAALATNVSAEIGAGNANLFGREQSGPGVDVTGRHAAAEGAGRLDLDLEVGVGQVTVELAPEPTFDVTCIVPDEASGDGNDRVTCPHPATLEGTPLSCSVTLESPLGGPGAGRAFCRSSGGPGALPKVGLYGTACEVPAQSDEATCAPLTPARRTELAGLRESIARDRAPTTTATTASTADVGGAPLVCGPPDASGERICTTSPASSTSTTVPASYRCREDPATKALTCVPG